ncbi:hypothetical protein QTO34_015367 [Cnephaeus nilssonii]|uniref:G-protein coupled receptors family 1 profile domain-containing protein n=1 Tax=Cnephaeus nilssonii TaxID=3371016 RepID=A0AA40LQM6_CNENI|nr:hypothetical protein QTO34_015367 [Eptesicus nilssonii]
MNPRLCGLLALVSWIMSVLNSLLHSLMISRLSFPAELEIPHFFCELMQMIKLACSDTFLNDTMMYFTTWLVAGGPQAGILYSYSKMVYSICRMSSVQGKYKAFSTCASNLSAVSLFYCTIVEEPELQPLIFGLFLSMYLITVLGNLLIILAVSSDSHLHAPMYFSLSNLSLIHICFTSTTIPKMLVNIQMQNKVITYEGCMTQMYFFLLIGGLDNYLLTVMAYDHFMSICHPLHYTIIMKPRLCGLLVLVSWIKSAQHSLLESLLLL